jgi:hypothetical protein
MSSWKQEMMLRIRTGWATYLPQQQEQTFPDDKIKRLCHVDERNVQKPPLLTTLLLQLA